MTPERLAEIEKEARDTLKGLLAGAPLFEAHGTDPEIVLSLCAALREAWEEVEHWKKLAMQSLDTIQELGHPQYGPCDAFADGECSVCEEMKQEARTASDATD